MTPDILVTEVQRLGPLREGEVLVLRTAADIPPATTRAYVKRLEEVLGCKVIPLPEGMELAVLDPRPAPPPPAPPAENPLPPPAPTPEPSLSTPSGAGEPSLPPEPATPPEPLPVPIGPEDLLPEPQNLEAIAEVLLSLPAAESLDHLLDAPPRTPLTFEEWRAAIAERGDSLLAAALRPAEIAVDRDHVTLTVPPIYAAALARQRAALDDLAGALAIAVTITTGFPGGRTIANAIQIDRSARSAAIREAAKTHPNTVGAARILAGNVSDIREL